jgi:hypothetical protein
MCRALTIFSMDCLCIVLRFTLFHDSHKNLLCALEQRRQEREGYCFISPILPTPGTLFFPLESAESILTL